MIRVEGENPETKLYADRIGEVLTKCHVKVYRDEALRIGTMAGIGLLLEVKNRNNPPPLAIPLIKELQELKVSHLEARENASTPEGQIIIWVLPKPEK